MRHIINIASALFIIVFVGLSIYCYDPMNRVPSVFWISAALVICILWVWFPDSDDNDTIYRTQP